MYNPLFRNLDGGLMDIFSTREVLLISILLHRSDKNLEILLTFAQLECAQPYKRKKVNIKINPNTLVAGDLETRLPPMCLGKKLIGHLHQALTRRCNQSL
jgi:hypothetical protein